MSAVRVRHRPPAFGLRLGEPRCGATEADKRVTRLNYNEVVFFLFSFSSLIEAKIDADGR